MKNKGFTLIELLVVIAVIGLLASIVLVSVNKARAKARDAKRVSDLKQISTALEMFYDNYGYYPSTRGHKYWDGHWMEFQKCLEKGEDCRSYFGDYSDISGYEAVITEVPQDPLDSDPETANNGTTYYYSWGECNDQMYVLRARLETDYPALESDADGNYYSDSDGGCEDPYYCIKQNWCH